MLLTDTRSYRWTPDTYIKKLAPGLDSDNDSQLLGQRRRTGLCSRRMSDSEGTSLHIPYSFGDYVKWVMISAINSSVLKTRLIHVSKLFSNI